MSQTYGVETVIADVGWLRTQEKHAISPILGHGASITHSQITMELHLGWGITADTMDEAINLARTDHFSARKASGVYVPRTTLFLVRQVDYNS